MGVRDLSEKHQRGYLDTSVSPWKPESGYEETEGHLKKSQALEGCSRKGEWPGGPVSTAG